MTQPAIYINHEGITSTAQQEIGYQYKKNLGEVYDLRLLKITNHLPDVILEQNLKFKLEKVKK